MDCPKRTPCRRELDCDCQSVVLRGPIHGAIRPVLPSGAPPAPSVVLRGFHIHSAIRLVLPPVASWGNQNPAPACMAATLAHLSAAYAAPSAAHAAANAACAAASVAHIGSAVHFRSPLALLRQSILACAFFGQQTGKLLRMHLLRLSVLHCSAAVVRSTLNN